VSESHRDRADLAQRVTAACRLEGQFVLRSGQTATTYFDKYLFEADPRLLYDIASALEQLVPEGTEVLAGLELGGIPIVTALSLETGLPAAFVRKNAKTYGTAKLAEGAEGAEGVEPSSSRTWSQRAVRSSYRPTRFGNVGPTSSAFYA
jgi:orotate phosphoribosyltransferase